MEETKSETLAEAAGSAVNGDEHTVREPTHDELRAEYVALMKRFPLPNDKDVFADIGWVRDHWEDPAVQAHAGRVVIVYEQKVLGGGDDPLVLKVEWAKRLGVNPARLVTHYISDGTPLNVELLDNPGAV